MTTSTNTGPVVVAVDGSPLAQEALLWGAAEASRRGLALHVVHVFVYVPVAAGRYALFDPATPEELAGQVVQEAAVAVRETHPQLVVTTETRTGPAAPEIIEASGQATMIVLGARGHGRVGGLLVGSVSQQVALHARCPVVVVRGTAERDPATPVVVGTDGSAEADRAVAFALGHAARAGAPLRVVHSEYVEVPVGAPPGSWYHEIVEQALRLSDAVRDAVLDAARSYPGVDVEFVTAKQHPVTALVAQSEGARLLVVASRGLGGFRGLLLGSVSQGVLSRAAVPVAVVPGPVEATD